MSDVLTAADVQEIGNDADRGEPRAADVLALARSHEALRSQTDALEAALAPLAEGVNVYRDLDGTVECAYCQNEMHQGVLGATEDDWHDVACEVLVARKALAVLGHATPAAAAEYDSKTGPAEDETGVEQTRCVAEVGAGLPASSQGAGRVGGASTATPAAADEERQA